MIDTLSIKERFEALAPHLDERARRLLAASEARAAGRGGIMAVSEATGVARSTIGRGLAELRRGEPPSPGRVRRPGGGRKPKVTTEPGLLEALSSLVQSSIRGDPEAALLWVSKSQRHLAGALAKRGLTASQKLVGRLLRRLGFSLQANSKTREGTSHPDRNAQFDYINAQIEAFQAAGQPTISVDTKKKELVGDFKNGGRELRPKGDPEPVRVHDFVIPELGKVAPYGVYDIAANTGWINLDTGFCLEALDEALGRYGKPQIFNTDQGGQFTNVAFTGRLEAAGIAISMDGRGRFMDNIFIERLWRSIKYEEVHLKAYADGREARAGIGAWMAFYNDRRPHQAMDNRTPMAVWRAGMAEIAAAAKTMDMPLRLDNARALPTCPQQQQKQQAAA